MVILVIFGARAAPVLHVYISIDNIFID